MGLHSQPIVDRHFCKREVHTRLVQPDRCSDGCILAPATHHNAH